MTSGQFWPNKAFTRIFCENFYIIYIRKLPLKQATGLADNITYQTNEMRGVMKESPADDFYENLQISPNADTETIERVYRMLAKRYHPDNGGTGNVEKFDRITKAYHILADPVRRGAYDVTYEQVQSRRWKLVTTAKAGSNGNGKDQEIRNAVLSILYIERRNDPTGASVGLYQLEKLLGWPEKMLEFHTWYLKEKGWIQRTDSGGYAITVEGIDALEQSGFSLQKDLLLPEPQPPAGAYADEADEVAVIGLKEIAAHPSHKKYIPFKGVLPQSF
jgi:curved DNA-binding protein